MKKLLLIAAVMGFTTLTYTATAQDEKVEQKEKAEAKEQKEKAEKKERKETQEIVIRKKGDKDTKITVEIKGDKVTINGKPLSEFKDGDITINKRGIKIWDGYNSFSFPEDLDIAVQGHPADPFFFGKKGAFLGVTTETANEGNDDKKSEGAIITNITKESAAEKAGLKEGDIITKINDKKVEGPESLADVVTSFKPKDEVTVYYKREGKEKSAKAVLGENNSSTAMAYSFSGPGGQTRSFTMPRVQGVPYVQSIPKWGNGDDITGLGDMKVNGFSMFPRQQKLGLKIQDTEEGDGVKVLDIDKESPAEKAGLKKDDVVTEIGGKKVTNTDDAREQLMENAEKSTYTIKAKRNGSEMSFDIKIPKKLKTANL
ncbi:PDZ domain-containing protein [Ferruginibacter sp. SUN106]|uniref:PDZ domain-containing protein n=1 Tax=Ferruginibacter sp. SUN106 TaxID=2978348 RepID=UPI003D35C0FD